MYPNENWVYTQIKKVCTKMYVLRRPLVCVILTLTSPHHNPQFGQISSQFFPLCGVCHSPHTLHQERHHPWQQQDKLKPAFTMMQSMLRSTIIILQKVSPKKAVDGTTTVTGKALAALAGGNVEAVNRPGALPDLDQGWQAVYSEVGAES